MPCRPVSVSSSTSSACRARLVESASLMGSHAQRSGKPRTAVIFMVDPLLWFSCFVAFIVAGHPARRQCANCPKCRRPLWQVAIEMHFLQRHVSKLFHKLQCTIAVKLQSAFQICFKTRNFSVCTKIHDPFPSPCLLPQNPASRILKPERKTTTHHKTWRYAI